MPASSIQVIYSSQLLLSCTVQGRPLPTVTWIQELSNGTQIQFFSGNLTSSQIVIIEDSGNTSLTSTFFVNSTKTNNAGNYYCQSQNILGTASSASLVEIIGKKY